MISLLLVALSLGKYQSIKSKDSSLSVRSKPDKTVAAQSKNSKKDDKPAASSKQKKSRVTYREGFYYEKIGEKVLSRIKGISYPKDASNCRVSINDLRYCRVKYVDFNGETQSGEMICSKKIADDVMEIFSELYDSGYEIESIRLIDDFDGDDEASMEANNTSCFNYRPIAGSSKLSNHSLGLAIDINPLYNPCITYDKSGKEKVAPANGVDYANRKKEFDHKIDEKDLAYKLFKKHGFTWGGDWHSLKDYQHFEKNY